MGARNLRFVIGERCGRARMRFIVRLCSTVLLGLCFRYAASQTDTAQVGQAAPDPISQFQGQTVDRISFEGVAAERLSSIVLPQARGAPLDREKVRESLRKLYATGLFNSVEALAQRDQQGITLIFRGAPRMFVGTVAVTGARGATANNQLERASRLNPGTRLTQAKMEQAL